MKRANMGVVGFGGIAKVHAIACYALQLLYQDLPFEPKFLKAYRREQPQAQGIFQEVVTSLDDLLEDKELDLIDICTPNYLHYEQVKKALEYGKAVYCEKPLALNFKEAKALVELATNRNLVNQVALIYRFMPAVVQARDYMASGKLGEIIHFKLALYHKGYLNERPLSWREQMKFSGGGALMDLGIHMADLLRFILGDIAAVRAELYTYTQERFLKGTEGEKGRVDVDEYAKLDVKLKRSGLGTIECSRISSDLNENTVIKIYGTQGSIKVTDREPRYAQIHRHAANITSIGNTHGHPANLGNPVNLGKAGFNEEKPGAKNKANMGNNTGHNTGNLTGVTPFYEFCRKVFPSEKISLGTAVDMHITSLYNMLLNLSEGKVIYAETPTFWEAAEAQKIIEMALISHRENNRWVKGDELD